MPASVNAATAASTASDLPAITVCAWQFLLAAMTYPSTFSRIASTFSVEPETLAILPLSSTFTLAISRPRALTE